MPGRAPPPFIGVLVLFPQISWREGIPHSDEGGGWVHNKGRVHGLGPWQGRRHQSWKSHRPTRTVGQRCRSSGVAFGDDALVSSVRTVSLSPKWQVLDLHCFGAALLTALYTGMATAVLASSRFGVSGTLQRAQSPCALCRGDRVPLSRGFPWRGWRSRQALGVVPSREDLCRGLAKHESLSRLGEPGP